MSSSRSVEDDLAARREVYERAGISHHVRDELERAILSSPSRIVGKGALRNVVSLTNSSKSSRPIVSESHSVERLRQLECELDPAIVSFYTQVPASGFQRITASGRRHVSSASLDLLVFYKDRIQAEECKTLEWLQRKVEGGATDWVLESSTYHHVPSRSWAIERGLSHQVWAPPEHSSRYRSNLLTLTRAIDTPVSERFLEICKELLSVALPGTRCTTASVLKAKPSATIQHVIYLLASRQLYAPLTSCRVEDETLPLGTEQTAMQILDRHWMDGLASSREDPNVVDEFLSGSGKARERAVKRLTTLERMRDGTQQWTRHYRELNRSLRSGRGTTELSHLVPNFANCGNSISRLSLEQRNLVAEFADRWSKGEWPKPGHAYTAYLNESILRSLTQVSKTTLYAAFKATDPAQRALRSGGLRAYQKQARRSHPFDRTEPPALAQHTVHIDATPLDVKGLLNLGAHSVVDRGTVYVARDSHGMPLACAFILGSARAQGLAILLRDYVKRNGELPTVVHCDRGPENESTWHRGFALGRYTLSINPTAAARFNQPAEDLINHINNDVTHWLKGNTLNDRMGRAVDGRFKSARTAALALPWIWDAVERYLFEEFPDSHRSDGISFRQDRDTRLTSLGLGGSPCDYNDDFLIATSLPQLKFTASEQLGVRTTNGVYLNSRMQDLLRTRTPSDIRADCVNPSLLWVQVGAQWFKALRSDAAQIFDLHPVEQIAKYCRDPLLRAIHRLHREELARQRLSAMRRNEEQSANEKSGMTVPSALSEGESSENASYADLEMPTLDEYGEL